MNNNRIGWKDAFLELLFPGSHFCIFCYNLIEQQKYLGVCEICQREILQIAEEVGTCQRCGRFSGLECSKCAFWGNSLKNTVSVVPYWDQYRDVVYALKYEQRKDIAITLGYLMSERLKKQAYLNIIDLVVPIPLHPLREEERGFNQSALLAQQIARQLGYCLDEKLLARKSFEVSQIRLGLSERRDNLRNAFLVKGKREITGQNILLVDDVMTTGATMLAAAEALIRAGAAGVYGVTWATGYNKKFLEWQEERPKKRNKAVVIEKGKGM